MAGDGRCDAKHARPAGALAGGQRVLGPLVGVLLAACAIAAAAPAALATTSPGGKADIGVRITNSGIDVFDQARMARGVQVTFIVENLSSRPQTFAILGKTTPPIKPGHQSRLIVTLLARGIFKYKSTLEKTTRLRRFSGLFLVY